MVNKPYEIPSEMREMAERSVEQARKAFEGFGVRLLLRSPCLLEVLDRADERQS